MMSGNRLSYEQRNLRLLLLDNYCPYVNMIRLPVLWVSGRPCRPFLHEI